MVEAKNSANRFDEKEDCEVGFVQAEFIGVVDNNVSVVDRVYQQRVRQRAQERMPAQKVENQTEDKLLFASDFLEKQM